MECKTADGVRFCNKCKTRLDDKEGIRITIEKTYPVKSCSHCTPIVMDFCNECLSNSYNRMEEQCYG